MAVNNFGDIYDLVKEVKNRLSYTIMKIIKLLNTVEIMKDMNKNVRI